MRSKTITVYVTVAIAALAAYIITSLARGHCPDTPGEWGVFSLLGVGVTVSATIIIGYLISARGRRKNRTTR